MRTALLTLGLFVASTAFVHAPARAQDEFDEFDDEFEDEFAEEGAETPPPVDTGDAEEDDALADAEDDAFADAEEDEAAPEAPPVQANERAMQLRAHNTFLGPSGGFRLVDAGVGAVDSFRIQLATEFFFASDFLFPGDQNDFIGGSLSFAYTPLDFLEIYGSVQSSANANDQENPALFQVLGDILLGVKGAYRPLPWLTVGGDIGFAFLNKAGDIGVVFGGTSFGFRGNASADLRYLPSPIPLIARFNAQYWFDNSAKLIEDVEAQRYQNLDSPLPMADETRHLLSRVERFALDINRTDFFNVGLGVEAPLAVTERFAIHPLVEWTLGVPVNRQDYNCLFVPSAPGSDEPAAGDDGCLDRTGFSAFPSTLTLGARVLPPVEGMSAFVGAEIGLTGTSDPVRELAANRPYTVLVGLSYAYDTRPRTGDGALIREVERRVEVRVPPPRRGRIRGVVVDRASGQPIAGAVVRFPGRELTPLYTVEDGRFVTYALEPGEIQLEVSHPDYETGTCAGTIPPDDGAPPAAATASGGAATEPASQQATSLQGAGAPTETGSASAVEGASDAEFEAAPAATPAPNDDNEVEVEGRCELVAKPRVGALRGRVVGEGGTPVAARLTLTGPAARNGSADPTGAFSLADLPPGRYVVRVESESHLIKAEEVEVVPRETRDLEIVLVPRPRNALVLVRQRDIQIRRQINFATDSAEILPSSFPLMTEIADVLIRNPQIRRVEIQGHTDNTGQPQHNLELSQRRAESVRTWLVGHGVEASRLDARGYGDTQPIVPNITPANRARNRRVQFIIQEQS